LKYFLEGFGRSGLARSALLIAAALWLGECGSRPAHVTGKTNTSGKAQSFRATTALERMPTFGLRDTAGREVSSAEYRGKVVLLDFWATWCAPCRREMPGYEGLYLRYKDRGFAVVGIAADSDARVVSRFAKKLGITYPLLINGMDVQRYGVDGLPTTILIDGSGLIREKIVGFEYTAVVENKLREILGAH
jgi:peroxiredoxin